MLSAYAQPYDPLQAIEQRAENTKGETTENDQNNLQNIPKSKVTNPTVQPLVPRDKKKYSEGDNISIETENSTDNINKDITLETSKETITIIQNNIKDNYYGKKVSTNEDQWIEVPIQGRMKKESIDEEDLQEDYKNQYSSLDRGNDIVEEILDKDVSQGDGEDLGRGYRNKECDEYNVDKVSMEVLERER